MAIKLSGMISGMDTDAMIDELIKAYSVRKDSYVKEQKALEYKQDAWKDMNSKIYKLFSGKLSSLRFSSAYSVKTVKSSNDNKVTVSGSSNAVNGTQELKITGLAKSGYLTGGVVGTDVKGDSKLSELGITDGGNITLKVDGKETTINVTGDMTVNSLVSKMKEAGVNASFDENNQRFFISSKNSGKDNDFALTGDSDAGVNVLKSLGLYTVTSTDVSAYQDFIDAAASDSEYIIKLAKDEYLDSLVNSIVDDLNAEKSGYAEALAGYKKDLAEANAKKSFAALSDEDKNKKIKELSDKIKALDEKIVAERAKETDGDDATVVDQAAIDSYQEEMDELLSKQTEYVNIKDAVGSSETDDFKTKLEEYNATIDAQIETINGNIDTENSNIEAINEEIKTAQGYTSATIADAEEFIANNGKTVDYDSTAYTDILTKYQNKLAYANEMVADYAKYNDSSTSAAEKAALAEKLGLVQDEKGATRIVGEDAEIYLNGAKFVSNTNVFQINGLTITAQALTDDDETISVTTATDVDGIYNMVKDFFKEYNEVMKGMEEAYNAASAGDYEPLTDEEMEAMTDKQIEKWETKVKDAVLRRDSTLSSIINMFKTNMMKSFEVDGEKLSLASFGIKTAGYFSAAENERGLYHIDGDPDDSSVSGNADKLKAAIAEDPDRFISFFSQLTENVYSELNKKMGTSSLSSAYTVYNDKYMKQQYDRYDDKISDWEDKVDAIREKYEKQFAAMETALSQLQSNSSYLSSMLGY